MVHQQHQADFDLAVDYHHQNSSPKAGGSHFHRKVRSKSDFRAAMKLAQTACSDIMEESGSSSAAVSNGFQMKSIKHHQKTTKNHHQTKTEQCSSSPTSITANKSVASQTSDNEDNFICTKCQTSFEHVCQVEKCVNYADFEEQEAELLLEDNLLMPTPKDDDCDSGTGSVDCALRTNKASVVMVVVHSEPKSIEIITDV